ncbi:MAG: hypothetical protein ACQEQ0_09930 [Bacteroidota bacterium]
MNQFTANLPTRVFNDKVYVYPSHDIHKDSGPFFSDWLCMEVYYNFSSENLTEWETTALFFPDMMWPG